ncbi:MAG TPA: zf-HC2 domain-containing protein [Candidatus Baltobacteraceae bacterium]|nr:zf-HC2 domain-containing protein [Candidatus Baltobacteraceae bacterium]
MRCSSSEILFDRYVEGTLPPATMQAVAAHLRTCDVCSALLTELRVVDGLLATTTATELPPNFTFAVMAEVRNAPARAPRKTPLWGALAFYLTAAWIALSTFVIVAGRAPWLGGVGNALRDSLANAVAAIAGAAHGVAPAGPLVVALVGAVLVLDAMLAAVIITYYRAIHPRLAARLATTEAS